MAAFKVISTPDQSQSPQVPETGLQKFGKAVGKGFEAVGDLTNNPLLSKLTQRTVARGAESALGLPGDIAQAVSNIAGVENKVPLPTSEGLRKGTRYLTGDYLEPKDNVEQVYDSFVGDLASILVPLPGSSAMSLSKAAKLAGVGTAGAQLAKAFGGGDLAQGLTKAGSQILASVAGGRRALSKQANALYEAADKAAVGKDYASKPLLNKSTALIRELNKGHLTDAKKIALEPLYSIQDKASYGFIPVQELQQFKKDVNTLFKDAPKDAIPYLKRVNGILKDSIKEYGEINPSFGKPLQAADKLYENLNGSLKAVDFIKSKVPDSIAKSDLTKFILYGSALPTLHGVYSSPIKSLAVAGGAGSARWGLRTYQLMTESPEARKYYVQALKDASEGSVKGASKNIAALDKQVAKFEKKHPMKGRFRVVSQ